ncbi:hypothetical protein [Caldivirga sp.]|uniref:hypothetical protein n=1 Tax=Caldivirga sp. TaxID=2080243 RepID=UPI003D0E79F3
MMIRIKPYVILIVALLVAALVIVMSSITHTHVSLLNSSFTGIVYILPSENSTPYWARTFGDRVFFYVYANLSLYKDSINHDFKIIRSAGYSFIVVIIPLADHSYPYYYPNLNLISELAYVNHLKVMWAIFPKWLLGPEWDYLYVNSTVYSKLVELMSYLASLNSTYRIAVWYGWPPSAVPLNYWCSVKLLSSYLNSLPVGIRERYVVWIDQPFDEYVNECGVPGLLNSMNVPAVTEEYSTMNVYYWYSTFREQYVTTGIWNAPNVEAWCAGFDGRVAPILFNIRHANPQYYKPRIIIIWIYWDVNDGSGELYRALTPGGLANPIKCVSQIHVNG